MTFRKMIATRPWGDLALAVVAAAFGWASLTYPFGRDLGLYFYVGREWALRGAIPYRDVLDHKTPGIEDDYVAVRGFQPQVYALARRRYPGRLFWTTFVLGPAGAKYGSEWIEADRRVLAAHPPKYACAYDTVHQTIESVEWWTARGYTVRTKVGDYIILEHTPETATERW